jgi:non-homologous end joining protein Ku
MGDAAISRAGKPIALYKVVLLTRLRSHDEVRDKDEFFDAIPEVTISPKMVEIAKQIIAQQHGSFDPSEFRDRYEEAVRDLIEAKADGASWSPGRNSRRRAMWST